MIQDTKVLAIAAQKGGVGKSATAINLGVALANKGHKVLVIDCDIHASCTIRLGYQQPDALTETLATILTKVIQEIPLTQGEAILHHAEGIDFVPSNRRLADIDIALAGQMSRETVLRTYIDTLRGQYEYILLDCLPSLGLLAINALAAADEVLLVTKADYDSAKGVEDLLVSIATIRKRIHQTLKIGGILFTMVDMRTRDARETMEILKNAYGSQLHIFQSVIPASVRAREAGKHGVSIFKHDGKGRVAAAYAGLADEVMANE